MDERRWTRWVMQTARDWEDIQDIVEQTGVSMVDHDHKRLAQYILELNNLMIELDRSLSMELVERQQQLLRQILSYTAAHFSREEHLIKKYSIPGLEEQKREHRKILSMIKEQLYQFRTGRISTGHKLRLHLLDWVIRHINDTDNRIFSLENMVEALLTMKNWDDLKGFIRSVHIPSIDHQHRLLTESIVELSKKIQSYQSIGSPEMIQTITLALEDSLRITREHFDHEMHLIQHYPIPDEELQKSQHDNFILMLENQLQDLADGDYKGLDSLHKNLLIWWIRHINIYDYRTFRCNNWAEKVLLQADDPEDIYWLISHTGIEQVDQDHRNFVVLLFQCRNLYQAKGGMPPMDEALSELKELKAYAMGHFKREEVIIARDFPSELPHHHEEHLNILAQLDQQVTLVEQGVVDYSPQFRKKLLGLWVGHTNGTDLDTFGVSYDG